MKKTFVTALTAITLLTSSNMMQAETTNTIFDRPFDTVHGTAPFSKIDDSQWMPAIDRGIELARQEVNAITMQRSRPDFENTIVALERSGEDLDRVLGVFYPLLSANSSDKMMEVAIGKTERLLHLYHPQRTAVAAR